MTITASAFNSGEEVLPNPNFDKEKAKKVAKKCSLGSETQED